MSNSQPSGFLAWITFLMILIEMFRDEQQFFSYQLQKKFTTRIFDMGSINIKLTRLQCNASVRLMFSHVTVFNQ